MPFTHLTPDPPFLMKTATLLYQTLFKKIKNEYEIALRIQLTQEKCIRLFLKYLQFCRTSVHKKNGRPQKLIVKSESLESHSRHVTEFIPVTSPRSNLRVSLSVCAVISN